MAASMIRRRLCSTSTIFLKEQLRHASTSYYVLLPEIPPDTPDTNAAMRYQNYPEYKDITPDDIITGCAKYAIHYDVAIGKHVEQLQESSELKTFESVFHPVEQITIPLSTTWRTSKNLNYTCSGDYRTAFQRVHPQVERARNERWTSVPLYLATKEVSRDCPNMTEFQRRLTDMYMLEARLNGIEHTGDDKQKFMNLLGKLVTSKTHYRNRVMLSHNLFSDVVDDYGKLEEVPKSVLTNMAADRSNPSRGPWKVTLNQPVYGPMMEYCSDRMLRWNLWRAYNTRASMEFDEQHLSNHPMIKEIQRHRKDIAQLLGYENFAQMSMETKMAGSVENVMHMIESMKAKFRPVAVEELIALENFAREEGFNGDLELWDIPYWRRRMKDRLFGMDAADVMQFFPFPKVLEGLFRLCHTLFGVHIKNCTGEVDTWHDSVEFYKVYDEEGGKEIAAFYVDAYARPEKTAGAWMEAGRERSALMGTFPISYLNLNLLPPLAGQPVLMTVDQVNTLFYEFGHGLQQMLTTVPYSEIAGQRNIEWDALQVCATTLSMLLHTPSVLQDISSHCQSGEKLGMPTVHTLLKGRRFLSSYDTMRQLYISALDMEMYVSDDHWQNVVQRVWPEFMPLQLHDCDEHACSMTAIFSDQYPAAFYSFKWAEMIAADVFGAFEEAGLDDLDKAALVGRRFRETFLSLGGGVPANEVFRRFRGRDPSQDALFKHYGLN